MNPNIKNPREALNKAYLRIKPVRSDIELFKANAIILLDHIKGDESEEHHKKLIEDFLKDTYYKPKYYINTKGRIDLVIHNGNDSTRDKVGVLFEVKSPTNKAEMPSKDDLNVKGLQELLYYFLHERITLKNLDIRHLIITNLYGWFIFDSYEFERYFAKDKNLVKQFNDFEQGRLSFKDTDSFYKEIAAPIIEKVEPEIEYTWFDIRTYKEAIRGKDKEEEKRLIALYKLLSPENLLKLSFANDSNTLSKEFYAELLYIIGLTEEKEGNKKLIKRRETKQREDGSLIENAISQIINKDKLSYIKNLSQYGSNEEEQLYNIALELSLTWINRILFLKLLEAQLLSYRGGNREYAFLNINRIKNFDDLDKLFFEVLAKKPIDRTGKDQGLFGNVPYLNSSLFEPTELEQEAIFMSNLHNDNGLNIYPHTVLKNGAGIKKVGRKRTLEYLFEFLDSFDFTSEGSEEIQEENKTLINASVLGLIFEKINGYKDGSYFTPGFITMYMSREAIRKAVVEKFNEVKGWNCERFDDIYNRIERDKRREANEIINKLKVCDPAVGSGHFLVSALNEIIAIKSELGILLDRDGKWLRDCTAEVSNDELIIIDENERQIFDYKHGNRESQRVQEALFHEKQTIIENCLFGVDINPNSVKICQLRLWIELLKHAYYTEDSGYKELETLPNIDINIKCGNSLISKFTLDEDLSQALRKSKWTSIFTYQSAVHEYQNAKERSKKRDWKNLINEIKSDFKKEIYAKLPIREKLNKLNGQLVDKLNQQQVFTNTKEQAKNKKEIEKLEWEIKGLDEKIKEIESNGIYTNAIEWRYEFPEVLGENGDFIGFDLVIGNPPYGVTYDSLSKEYFKNSYESAKTSQGLKGSLDTFSLFVEKGLVLGKENSMITFIVPMAITSSDSMASLHEMMFKMCETIYVSSYSNRPKKIFDHADQRISIIQCFKNNKSLKELYTSKVNKRYAETKIEHIVEDLSFVNSKDFVRYGRIPKIGLQIEIDILRKLFANSITIKQLLDESGLPVYYRSSGGRYYNIITNYSTDSTKEKSFRVESRYRNIIAAILSSNLYYWFYHIYSNNLDLRIFELELFPIPINRFSKVLMKQVGSIYKEFLEDLNRHARIIKADYVRVSEFTEFKARYSKHIIDKIDLAIQKAYGLTDEEIKFIINYDIEFRTDDSN